MEKERIMQIVKNLLVANGFSTDDFVKYFAKENKTAGTASQHEFPFEVVYDGLVRSWVPLEGKIPLGVIIDKTIIALKDFHVFSHLLTWDEARIFQRASYARVDVYEGTAGNIRFWKKLIGNPQKQKALDDLLVQLGGEPIAGKWYWSETEYDVDKAFAWNFADNYPKPLPKHEKCYVRIAVELFYRLEE